MFGPMTITKYCQLIADVVRQGSKGWNAPRLSDWSITGTGGSSASVDIADIATLGTTVAVPINVNLSAGVTELALFNRAANLSFIVEGVGGGTGVGIGWALPASFTYAGGQLGTENWNIGGGMDLPSGGIGSLIAGPKAHSVIISPNDLVTPSAEKSGVPTLTLVSAAAGTQGQGSLGVAIFADRPVLNIVDLAYTKAIALTYGMQFVVGNAISASVSAGVFKISLRNSSLPFPGARYGASIAK